MKKGDIVLIPFPFTNLSGSKYRPALILSAGALDITVCFITSQIQHPEAHDVAIQPTSDNGLKKASLIRVGRIATLDKKLAQGILGVLDSSQIPDVNAAIRAMLLF